MRSKAQYNTAQRITAQQEREYFQKSTYGVSAAVSFWFVYTYKYVTVEVTA